MMGEGPWALAFRALIDVSVISDHSGSFYQKGPTDAHRWCGVVFGSLDVFAPRFVVTIWSSKQALLFPWGIKNEAIHPTKR
ncbi:hypothetical protein [Roseibacillus persicicus]|uniref:hypothetical protein n=1 Tax=Roseibacillus persicicus TaxID=454148 RepID=UPI00167256AB